MKVVSMVKVSSGVNSSLEFSLAARDWRYVSSLSLSSSNSRTVKVVDWKACVKDRDCKVKCTVELGVRERSSSICRSMVRLRACVNSSPRLSEGVASRCCVSVASYRCLLRTFFQFRRAPTGRSSKSSMGWTAPPYCMSSSSSSSSSEKASS